MVLPASSWAGCAKANLMMCLFRSQLSTYLLNGGANVGVATNGLPRPCAPPAGSGSGTPQNRKFSSSFDCEETACGRESSLPSGHVNRQSVPPEPPDDRQTRPFASRLGAVAGVHCTMKTATPRNSPGSSKLRLLRTDMQK